jgi:hypothetical protein
MFLEDNKTKNAKCGQGYPFKANFRHAKIAAAEKDKIFMA